MTTKTEEVHELRGRAANRQRRRQEYIDTATRMVLGSGLEALTMYALAREMGAAVGTAYTYFASKSALVAELEIIAIQRNFLAYQDASARWLEAAAPADERERAELSLLCLVEFSALSPMQIADEHRLQMLALTDGGRVVTAADLETVMDALGTWHADNESRLGAAVDAGVLSSAATGRAEDLSGAIAGLVLYLNLPNAGGLDVPVMVRRTAADLLVAWGADRDRLDAASAKLAVVAGDNPLRVPAEA